MIGLAIWLVVCAVAQAIASVGNFRARDYWPAWAGLVFVVGHLVALIAIARTVVR